MSNFYDDRQGCGKSFDKSGAITPEECRIWSEFMHKQGIKRVLSLLWGEDNNVACNRQGEYVYFAGGGYKNELMKNGFDEEKVLELRSNIILGAH